MPKSEKEIWSYFRKEIQHLRIGRDRETDRETDRQRQRKKESKKKEEYVE